MSNYHKLPSDSSSLQKTKWGILKEPSYNWLVLTCIDETDVIFTWSWCLLQGAKDKKGLEEADL